MKNEMIFIKQDSDLEIGNANSGLITPFVSNSGRYPGQDDPIGGGGGGGCCCCSGIGGGDIIGNLICFNFVC